MNWLLNPPPVVDVPTNALVAIASVAVVIWTGGFIVRGWVQSTSAALLAGMSYLQYAFFAAMLALLANALTLRIVAVLFVLLYASFFARHTRRLSAREPNIELFLPYVDALRVSGKAFWTGMQIIEFIPLAIVFIWPDPRVVAWACAIMTFLGYQIILAFVYRDLYDSPGEG
jgi:hypothetical protein